LFLDIHVRQGRVLGYPPQPTTDATYEYRECRRARAILWSQARECRRPRASIRP